MDTQRQRHAGKAGGMAYRERARTIYPSARVRRRRLVGLLVVIAATVGGGRQLLASSPSSTSPSAGGGRADPVGLGRVSGDVWPAYGQAAIQIGQSRIQAGPDQRPAPIASVAKVMTA